ncbi:STAS domain-containing protein [Thioclava sp. F36-6]|uniref:STAS domain-containing protein n=1 Tax=Thioclava sp. F36-6 TaxID=1915316 RepID=UPI000996598C|nr:STAS domain-containing protein [Thioclava sp. F36-6]OOY30752.1 hypothetical protein BMI88_16550 [Thioclava sp. F36-6]
MTALALPDRIDLATVRPLQASLQCVATEDVALDASSVTHFGALGLQLLLSAAKTARIAGHRLEIAESSEAFDNALTRFGLSHEDLQHLPDAEAPCH